MTTPPEIRGGYVLLSRRIFEGSYAGRPPWEFMLWVWMLAEANHQQRRDGQKLGRGQLLTTLARMQDAVAYMVGSRRVAPGRPAIAKYLRRQREGNAVATAKTTRGLIITIVQYDYYQTAANYESNGEDHPKARRRVPERAHDRQEGQESKKDKNTDSAAESPDSTEFANPLLNDAEFAEAWRQWKQHRTEIRHALKPTSQQAALKKLVKMGKARAIAAIENSISNGYQGLIEPKDAPNRTNTNRKPAQTVDILPPSNFDHLADDPDFIPL